MATSSRTIKKSLITEEDLELGDGTVEQERNGIVRLLNKLNFIFPLSDMTKFASKTGLYDGQVIYLKSYNLGSNKGGGHFEWDASLVRTNHNGGTIISPSRDLATEGLATFLTTTTDTDTGCWVRKDIEYVTPEMFGGNIKYSLIYADTQDISLVVNSDTTVNIPTDSALMQTVADHVRVSGNYIVTISIESGHAPSSGISVSDGNYSFINVTSIDATVTLDASFSTSSDFIEASRASAPKLSCLIDANSRCRHGYHVTDASNGYVSENCGVINTSGAVDTAGLHVVYASECYAKNTVFTGNYRNLWVAHESQCYADFSDFSACTGDVNVYAARSSILGVSYCDMTNSAGAGLRSRRSRVTALAADTSNAAADGILAQECSVIVANDQAVDPFLSENCGQNGVSCDDFSVVDITGGSTIGSTNSGIRVTNGGQVVCSSATLSTAISPSQYGINSDSGRVVAQGVVINSPTLNGIAAFEASIIDATGCTISNSGSRSIDIGNSSNLNAKSSTITGGSSDGIRCQNVSLADVSGATVQCSGVDLVVGNGGQICANGTSTTSGSPALSDTNVSAFNAIDPDGIIWT